MAKKGTPATRTNVKDDDILVDRAGELFRVYGDVERGTFLAHNVARVEGGFKFLYQAPTSLNDPRHAPWTHAGEKYVRMPPPEPVVSGLEILNGWLDREGRLYGCEYAEHGRLARSLCVHHGLPRVRPYYAATQKDDPHDESVDWERSLEKAGYIKLSNYGRRNGADKAQFFVHAVKESGITERQRDTILEWCAQHNVLPPYIIEHPAETL